MQEYSVEITLNHPDDVLSLFGTNERHLKLIEENLNVIIHARTERVQILGDDEESVELARFDHSSPPCFGGAWNVSQHLRCCCSLNHGSRWFD